ncbi:MAG: hypothetical protein ACKOOD_00430 [Microbacteriaceae bacterium]
MQLQAVCERTAEGWEVEVPELGNLKTSAKRLDKVEAHIREIAKNHPMAGDCELVIEIIAKMPGIICDVEAAQAKMREATRLQEEASNEIRNVVSRMRDEGLTLRDIAVLLGVTPQRVAQLVPCE